MAHVSVRYHCSPQSFSSFLNSAVGIYMATGALCFRAGIMQVISGQCVEGNVHVIEVFSNCFALINYETFGRKMRVFDDNCFRERVATCVKRRTNRTRQNGPSECPLSFGPMRHPCWQIALLFDTHVSKGNGIQRLGICDDRMREF